MPGRILTLQRQVRELGRLRSGWSEPQPGGKRPKPVKSKTWLVTSPAKEYVEAAAETWGGTVELWKPQGSGAEQWRVITEAPAIDALLPPGDPVSQAYEMWSGGGCQRRCDGETAQVAVGERTESRPCPCRQEFQDEFYKQPAGKVCKPTTRLGLIVPELPDLGIWRVETHGFYAANEVTAMVDLIKSRVDPGLVIPVTLRIEPRTRVVAGKTKQFTVVTVGLRGATAQQILAGAVPALELNGAPKRIAIEGGPVLTADTATTAEQFKALARDARDPETIRVLWDRAGKRGVLDKEDLRAFLTARAADLGAQVKNGDSTKPVSAPPAPVEVVDGEPEPDADAVMMQILATSGAAPYRWSAERLEQAINEFCGKSSSDANGWELQAFLDALKNGQVAS